MCGRDYSLDPQAPQPGPRYTITNAEQMELWSIKKQSYKQNRSRLILLARDLFAGDSGGNLLATGGMNGIDNTSPSKVSWLSGVTQGINFTSDTQHVEFDRLHTTRFRKTLIRTMPDRSANINDVCWALRNADKHQIGMNVLLLHRWSFVWISILPPPADNDTDLSAQHTSLLIAELQKKYFLLKLQFGAINKLLAGVARVEWHNYVSYTDLVFSGGDRSFYTEPIGVCAACHQTHHTPASNVQNATQPEFSGDLTNGDLAELLIMKVFSFETERAMVGFLSGVSGADRSQSIQTKLQINDARNFFQETHRARYFRPLRNVNLFSASDELWDNHQGEQTVFRTMPDRNAKVKDLTWALEASARHRIGMNVYLLHKRHLLGIHVMAPVRNADANQIRKEKVRTRLLVSKVNQHYTLEKQNLHKLNRALYPTAKIAYLKYPNLSLVESITEDTVNESLLSLQILAAVALGFLVYNNGVWSPMEWVGQPVLGAARSVGEAAWGPFTQGIGSAAAYGVGNMHRMRAPTNFAAKWGVAKPIELAYKAGKGLSKGGARWILAEELRDIQASEAAQQSEQPPEQEGPEGRPEEGPEGAEGMPEEGPEGMPEGGPEGTEGVPEGGPRLLFDESGTPTMPSSMPECLPACRDNLEVPGTDCNECVLHDDVAGGAQGLGFNPGAGLLR